MLIVDLFLPLTPKAIRLRLNQSAIGRAADDRGAVSGVYLRSAYCRTEWRNIFTTDVDGRDRRLVPVCIEKCSEKELGVLAKRFMKSVNS